MGPGFEPTVSVSRAERSNHSTTAPCEYLDPKLDLSLVGAKKKIGEPVNFSKVAAPQQNLVERFFFNFYFLLLAVARDQIRLKLIRLKYFVWVREVKANNSLRRLQLFFKKGISRPLPLTNSSCSVFPGGENYLNLFWT